MYKCFSLLHHRLVWRDRGQWTHEECRGSGWGNGPQQSGLSKERTCCSRVPGLKMSMVTQWGVCVIWQQNKVLLAGRVQTLMSAMKPNTLKNTNVQRKRMGKQKKRKRVETHNPITVDTAHWQKTCMHTSGWQMRVGKKNKYCVVEENRSRFVWKCAWNFSGMGLCKNIVSFLPVG